ncbi:efflux transporter outer membrane subunit [Caballeronia sp. SEWSISQ10-4 2]|uniref:efflux transporter outer membrane subunit n=1 Tax=Caballeronia sp. SEWSISQ10-4 2 TaxID=2937438 RepID=UPI0026516FD5|nr:efflux transporter outer membrane subunit [Caballeronia sp. SEWSISQ10-4 2]MDN7181484.1 efflux transporter outer membrane subunit [Caballeronia sp. SEWSISQ10-4 2]
MFSRPFAPLFLTLLAAVCAISACTVGPDYAGAPQVAPDAARAANFVRVPAVGIVSTRAPNQWWLALNDPQLNTLIDAALAHNPDIHAAQARLRESRAQLQHEKANGMPKGTVDAAALRMRQPNLSALSSSGGGPLQLYTAGFDATWEIDLFGGTRRAVEAATAEADAVDADLADTQVSLAAEVAQAYVDLRDEQQRLTLAQRSAEIEQRMLTLTQQRRAHGTAADVDVERLTTQVENTRATLTPLDEQVEASLDQLAVLTGQAPGALDQELSALRPMPALPASVPVGDPASMLQQRPDIRAAERRLASSNAQIGEHKADFFPKVTLFGDIGYTAANPGHLLRQNNFSWIGAPYLQWNVLDFGRTLSSVHGAEASRDEADAKYAHTVLAALQDANTSLSRYGHQREHLATLQQVQASADRSATLMRQRYTAGTSSLIDLLDTQRTQFSAQQNVVAGQAELLKDFVSLQKSLGLGWRVQG